MTWLRELALAVIAKGGAGSWLRPYQLLQFAIERGIETNGVPLDLDADDQAAWGNALRAIGRKLGNVMKEDRIEIDAVVIERRLGIDASGRSTKEYAFSPASRNSPNAPAIAPAMETSVSAMPQSVVNINKRACAPAHAPAQEGTFATHCGIAGALRECKHLDQSTWILQGESMVCAGCGKFMGRPRK